MGELSFQNFWKKRPSDFSEKRVGEGGDLFEGGAGGDTFYIKNKLKSEIFKSKKKKIS